MPDFLACVDTLAGQLATDCVGFSYAVVVTAHLLVARQMLLSVKTQCEGDIAPEVDELIDLIERFAQAMHDCSALPAHKPH